MSPGNSENLQKERNDKLGSLLRSLNLDAIVVTCWDNIRFLTGSEPVILSDWYVDTGAAIFPLNGEPAIVGGLEGRIADGIKTVGAWKANPFADSNLVPKVWTKAILGALKEYGIINQGKIGVDTLPITVLRELEREKAGIEFTPVLYDLLRIRAVKTKDEITLMRRAASIIDAGMRQGLKSLKVGISEREVFAEISGAMFRAGSELLPWTPTCTGQGDYSDMKPKDYRMKDGDSIRWDVGSLYKGYFGDGSRTGVVGHPTDSFRKLYSATFEAYMNGVKAIRPGNMASDVDYAVRSSLENRNLPVIGNLGHGIGMRIFELPWISQKDVLEEDDLDVELRPGMVMTLEPESSADGKFVRLEDMILVTETGNELLTRTEYLGELT